MFEWLIVHSVVTAAMAVAVAAAGRFFRLGPAARHLLWLVVLVKLLTPPLVHWPWPLPGFAAAPPPPTGPAVVAVRTVVIDEAPAGLDAAPPTPAPSPDDPTKAPPAGPPAEARPAAPPISWDGLPAAAGWAWLAGGAWMALRNGLRIRHWRGRLAHGRPAPQWLAEQVRHLAASMGVRPPRPVVMPGVASPMVWGFGAPRLIWPLGLEERLSEDGRGAVLLHELAHLRRRDHWVGWLLLAGACVWWWHPLFWWVRRRLAQETELACDAQVVGAAPDGRRAYAEALLEVSQRLSSAAAVPALGAASDRRDLERRLVMIMRGPAARRLSWAALAAVGALALLALPAWTLGEDPKPTPAPTVRSTEPAAPADATPTVVAAPAPETAPGSLTPAPAAPPTVTIGRSTATTPVPGTVTRPAADAAPPAAAPDPERDKKLKELEEKIQQLLKEIQELRGPNSAPPPASGDVLYRFLTESKPEPPAVALPAPAPPAVVEIPVEVITLTRVSYKLKPATAEALAAFLKDNIKTAILETKVDGENLVVTTTPDAQHAIGQFIALIQGKTPVGPPMMGPPGGVPYGLPPGTP